MGRPNGLGPVPDLSAGKPAGCKAKPLPSLLFAQEKSSGKLCTGKGRGKSGEGFALGLPYWALRVIPALFQ